MFFFIWALWFSMGYSQNILLVEKANFRNNVKYFEGDEISFRTLSDTLISGELTACFDSTIIIDGYLTFQLDEIEFIRKRLWAPWFFSELFYKAGIPYFFITTINRAINHDQPVIREDHLIISASLVGAALIMHRLAYKKYRLTNGNWKIKILEM